MAAAVAEGAINIEHVAEITAFFAKVRLFVGQTIDDQGQATRCDQCLDFIKTKVGGHQASCATVTAQMTALYYPALRPENRDAGHHLPHRRRRHGEPPDPR